VVQAASFAAEAEGRDREGAIVNHLGTILDADAESAVQLGECRVTRAGQRRRVATAEAILRRSPLPLGRAWI